MPYPATGSPGDGESSAVAPVLPSREASMGQEAGGSGSRLREWQQRSAEKLDSGAQVDLRVHAMDHDQPHSSKETPSATPAKGSLHFVAGGLGGLCGAIVTSPLDVVKTRLQSNLFQAPRTVETRAARGVLANARRMAYHFVETGHILRNIAVRESPRALFKGLGPTLVGVIPARSINFYTYGNGKLFLADRLNGGKESSAVHLLAAACAGVVTATATNPIWVVKTRLQLESHAIDKAIEANRQAAVLKPGHRVAAPRASISTLAARHFASDAASAEIQGRARVVNISPTSKFFKPRASPPRPSTNSLEMTLRIIRQEGMTGLYKGMSASYLGVAEGTIQWTLYEKLKRASASSIDDGNASTARQWISTVGAAGGAKMTASLITYPHEVLRTRLRQDPGPQSGKRYTGLVQTFRLILKEEGPAAFYGGLSAHLLRVVPNAAIMFVVYETMLKVGR